MAIITGRVDRVIERNTNFGQFFALQVDGTSYGLGKALGGISQGDYVEFVAEQNVKGYWDIKKGTVKPAAKPADAPKEMGAKPAVNSGYNDSARQDSIIYQSSRKDAVEFLKLLHEAGAIDVGKLKGAEKMALYEGHLDRLTSHFIKEVKDGTPYPSQPLSGEAKPASAKAVANDDPNDDLPF